MSTYKIKYHSEVFEDVSSIPKNLQTRIRRSISERLTTSPLDFGAPLSASLSGLRKLRVGDYRMVYEVSKTQVTIWGIRHRRNVYPILSKRRKKR